MVGHTHEDVDALFGTFSHWLKRNDAATIPGKTVLFRLVIMHAWTMPLLVGKAEVEGRFLMFFEILVGLITQRNKHMTYCVVGLNYREAKGYK